MLDEEYKRVGPYLAFLAIVVLLVGATLASLSQSPPLPAHQQHTETTPTAQQGGGEQRGTPSNPFVVETHEAAPSPEITAQRAEDRAAHAAAETWIARGTVILAIFTAVLAIATFALVYRAWRQERHFTSSERAYVTVSHRTFELDNGRFVADIRVKNSGKTPGTVTRTSIDIEVLPDGAPEPTRPRFRRQNVGPETHGFLVTNDGFHFDWGTRQVPVEDIREGRQRLWLYGRVDYEDAFGERYSGGYCRMYISELRDLRVWGGRSFNYDRLQRENPPEE